MLGLTSSVAKVLLVAATGGIGLPFGVPPAPDDPVLASVLPEKCVLAVSWAGTASPDPKSPNQTEQLLAEPEVQTFLTQIDRLGRHAFEGVLKAGGKDDPTSPIPGNALRSIITHPGVVFLSSVKSTGKPDSIEIEGGMVLSLGGDAAMVEAASKQFGPLLWKMTEDAIDSLRIGITKHKVATPTPSTDEIITIDGHQWHRVAGTALSRHRIVYGFRDNYLIVGIGEKGLENILARTKQGKPPAWWSDIKAQLPIERRSIVLYADVRGCTDLILSQQDAKQQAKTRAMLEFAGLSNATAWIEVWGLEGEDFANKTLLALDGPPRGLLQPVSDQPLKPENLAPIPRDATVAAAFRLDLEKALDVVLASYEKMDPKTKADVTQTIDGWGRSLGIDLRHGTLKSVGDTWCVYGSPSEGNLFITGLTAVVPLRDWAGMNLSYGRLMGAAKRWSPNREQRNDGSARTSRIEQFSFAGNDAYWLNATDESLLFLFSAFTPSWCMTKKEMIVAISPQNVKAYLSHDGRHEPLNREPRISKLFSKDDGPVMVAYGDSLSAFKLFYPIFSMQVGMYLVGIPTPGADPSMLPSGSAINRHLGPTVATLRRSKHGIEFISRGTIPLPSATLFAAFFMAEDIVGIPDSDAKPAVRAEAHAVPAPVPVQPAERKPATPDIAPPQYGPPTPK